MKYPAYEKYKPSGVEWLGKVPEDWEMKCLRYACRFAYGDSLASDDREDGDVLVYGSNGPVGSHRASNTGEPVIIVGRKGSHGKVNYSKRAVFAIDTTYFLDQRHTANDLRWLFYMLGSLGLDAVSKDSAVPGLAREDAYQHFAVTPPLLEQRAIADYLDVETVKLDTLIAKKQELIEKLKEKRAALISRTVTRGLPPEAARTAGLSMSVIPGKPEGRDPESRGDGKDWIPASAGMTDGVRFKPSGTEWLGEVPEHWEESRIRFEAIVVSKGTTPSTIGKEIVDEGIRFIKAENIQDGKVLPVPEFFIDDKTDQLLTRSRLKPHDILVVIAGATTGKAAMLSEDLLPANTNQAVCFIRLKNPDYAPILAAWLSTKFIQDIVWNSAVQAAQPNLAMEDIKAFPCLIPPVPEQRAIADYLDRETSKIDRMVEKVEAAIERLQEYRAALITAAVTGKIDVRNNRHSGGSRNPGLPNETGHRPRI